MIPRCSVFIATSLDGFIARPDGSIDWLEAANARVPAGEDCGYGAFVAGIDALVMGRRSFETVAAFDAWPYADLRVVVQTRRPLAIDATLAATVTASAESPLDLARRLGTQGARRLYIDGGETIRRFLAAGLIDEITITTVPVLLGEGRPLFTGDGGRAREVELELLSSRSWPFGFVQSRYRVQGFPA